jgi:hypothetical protein
MDLLLAVRIAEGEVEVTEDECIEAWQWLIDEGHVWRLQGWYGRTATELIEAGVCVARA